jgi:hypothetical protein
VLIIRVQADSPAAWLEALLVGVYGQVGIAGADCLLAFCMSWGVCACLSASVHARSVQVISYESTAAASLASCCGFKCTKFQ